MNLTETITEQIKQAMKSGDRLRLETLRSIRAGILEFEKSGTGREMTPDDEFAIVISAAKKRKDAIEQYDAVGRSDAAQQERAELQIIMEFMPAQLSREEIQAAVMEIASQIGASQPGDFGKLMSAATKTLRGKADGGLIQQVAKALLSGN